MAKIATQQIFSTKIANNKPIAPIVNYLFNHLEEMLNL